jgi:Cu(I)/Ag(I) efflux system membrane fusion protein
MTMDFRLAPDLASLKPTAGSEIDIEFRLQDDDAPQIVKWQIRDGRQTGGAQ